MGASQSCSTVYGMGDTSNIVQCDGDFSKGPGQERLRTCAKIPNSTLTRGIVVSQGCSCRHHVTILASGLLFFLPFPYLVAVFSLLCTTLLYLVAIFLFLFITLHYWGNYSLLFSTFVRFLVGGGYFFFNPPFWHSTS